MAAQGQEGGSTGAGRWQLRGRGVAPRGQGVGRTGAGGRGVAGGWHFEIC